MSRLGSRPALAVTAGVAVLALAGCQGASITDVTLPGGATSSDVFGSKPTNTYTVMFNDVLDLVPQASVRMNDVDVGDVRTIALDDNKAKVTIRVLKTVNVPANVEGVISQSSLLGEKYVNLVVANGDAMRGSLPVGSTIPTDKTSDELQIEDVFGALSELLNGGGIQQLQSISADLSQLLTGRESNLRNLLQQFTVLAGSLDARRTEITNALDALNKLAVTLKGQQGVIKEALSDISPGLVALNDSRADLITLLRSLNSLGTVATRVQRETQADTVSDLRTLQPTLDRLNSAGDSIVNSLQLLVTYPFGDNALKAIFSDYTGLYATLTIDLRNGSTANPLGPSGLCGSLTTSTSQICGLLGMIDNALPGTGSVPLPSLPIVNSGPTPSPSASAGTKSDLGSVLKGLGISGGTTSASPTGAPAPASTPGPVASVVGGLVGGLTGGTK